MKGFNTKIEEIFHQLKGFNSNLKIFTPIKVNGEKLKGSKVNLHNFRDFKIIDKI